MSDTPRTDALPRIRQAGETEYVPIDDCRQIERELTDAKEKATTAWSDNLILDSQNRKLERELAKARKQRDIAIEAIKEIMANEEGLHRMGYNPYLISHAAMEKISNYET